jgi:hypothetical protein
VTEDYQATVRRCRRLMLMVSHLHQRGFQRVRLCPGIAPSGVGWRGLITVKSNTLVLHGARVADHSDDLVARYGSGQGNEYFGWTDRKSATAEQLADTFLERFPRIADLGGGRDWSYVGWYSELLGHSTRDLLPVAIEEYGRDDAITFSSPLPIETDLLMPLPPPGEADQME